MGVALIRGRGRRVVSVAACGVLVTSTVSGCFAEASAMPAVRDFLIAWQVGNFEAAAKQTVGTDQQTVETSLRQVRDQLDAASMKLGLGLAGQKPGGSQGKAIVKDGDDADARFSVKIDLGENGQPFSYAGHMHLKRIKGKWRVIWSPSIIHPGLKDGERLAVVTETQPRGTVQDAGSRSLLKNVKADQVGVLPGALADPKRTITQLVEATKIDGRALDAERLLGRVRSAPPQTFLPLVTLQRKEHAGLTARLQEIDGLRFREITSPEPAMAQELTGTLGPATADRLQQVGAPYQPGDTIGVSGIQFLLQRRLAGTPTVSVVAQSQSGEHQQVLWQWPGQPAQHVRTSLDHRMQSKAQQTLAGLKVPASMTVIRSNNGEVLAVANRSTRWRNRAMEGRYPPGLTFGIVSAEALLHSGMTERDPTDCPATVDVGGQAFANPVAPRRRDSFQMNFAFSCATTLAGLSTRLSAATLLEEAGRLGFGKDWGLSVPAFSGFVPTPANDAEKAAISIGQGVQVSPLSMALLAGAVETGTWRPPFLLQAPLDKLSPQAQPLEAAPAGDLKRFMQRSVASGTAKAAKVSGGGTVHGVTAVVNYTEAGRPRTVSWFVGFRAGIAFAIAIEGNVPAAKIAARFLKLR